MFITFEGLEGVGKSTQIELLGRWLKNKNIDFIITREPGGTVFAETIRQLLLQEHEEIIEPITELLLIFAARKQHVERVIKPALAQGLWVICDRFCDASYAYQGGGRELKQQNLQQLEQLVLDDLKPDKTFLLDCDAFVGLSRAQARGKLDRIESETIDFFERCRQAYLTRAQLEPNRISILDASWTIDKLSAQIITLIEAFCID